jgi:hypothetical protein
MMSWEILCGAENCQSKGDLSVQPTTPVILQVNVTTYHIMNVFCPILNTIIVHIALGIMKLKNNGLDYELCAVENSKAVSIYSI